MLSIWGFAIGFGATLFITELFYRLRGVQGLGGGDIKLFGILGILWGPQIVLNIIFLSCLLGAIIGGLLILSKKLKRDEPMAFGPYIIIVSCCYLLFPQYLTKYLLY